MSGQLGQAKQWQYSMRDLALAVAGMAVLIVWLKWSTATAASPEVQLWFHLLCSLPMAGGMMGLLLRGMSGGVCGAYAGATLACLIRLIVGLE